jgi:ribonuclease HI
VYRGHEELVSASIGLGARAEVYDAEMMALSESSRAAIEIVNTSQDPISTLYFFSDNSSAVQSIFTAKLGPAQSHSIAFRERILSFLLTDRSRRVVVQWVPSHKGVLGNERADTLAKDAAAMQGTDCATYSHLRRRAKESQVESWREVWNSTVLRGLYAQASMGPPSSRPPPHFYTLPRRLYGLVTQCRTGHAFIGEYYYSHLPSEDTKCPCDHHYQTRAHIIQECDLYSEYRPLLRRISPDLSLPDLLSTKKGIRALAQFILKTGAFTKTGEESLAYLNTAPLDPTQAA